MMSIGSIGRLLLGAPVQPSWQLAFSSIPEASRRTIFRLGRARTACAVREDANCTHVTLVKLGLFSRELHVSSLLKGYIANPWPWCYFRVAQTGELRLRMTKNPAEFAPLRFSTHELPERKRLQMWREELGRNLLRVDIEASADLPVQAEATLRALPGLGTVAYIGAAVRLQRTRATVADGDDSIGVIVNLGESGTVIQRGREVALGAGDAVALLHHEPATVAFAQGSYLGVLVPRAALASRLKNVDDATMRLIPHGTEPLRLLVTYLRLVADGLVLAQPKLRRVVVNHVHDLVALALTSHHRAGESGVSAAVAARLNAALDHITANFQDPELSVAAVAQHQGISPRYLQRLLEKSGSSFIARVTELRLQRAFALLTDTGLRRISDIALDAGFSDISYFNRLFRARFGDTPSAVRAQSRQAAGPAAHIVSKAIASEAAAHRSPRRFARRL
jgi:AraC-like DNA-binding protein